MPGGRSAGTSLRAVLDHTLDVALALVAWWSLFYWVGLATQWSLWPSGWLWLVTSPVVAWLVVRLGRPAPDAAPEQVRQPWSPGLLRRFPGTVWVAAALVGVVAAACLGWPSTFKPVWVLLLLATVVAVLARLSRGPAPEEPPAEAAEAGTSTGRSDLVAAGLALAVAALSLFIHLPDLDDPFYLNRSVWVAEHGNASLLDTMFGPERFPTPYNGGLPIASIEAQVGVLSHMSGISSGTLTWIGLTFLGAFATVWAFWRLSRTWARRTPLLALGVAVAFMLMSGESRLGNFWIARMWQGKVLALTILVPLVWAWATDLAEGRNRRRSLVMLTVGGAAFVGLTSTAVMLAPIITGAMLVGALFQRRLVLAVGGVLFSLVPLASGVAVVLTSTVGGRHPAVLDPSQTFLRVFGTNPVMVALALAGVVAGVLALRSLPAAVMVGAAWLACMLVYVPGLLPVLNRATGAGPVLWRTFYCVPVAVLLGVAATAWPGLRSRVPGPARTVSLLAVPALLVALVAVAGAPLWTTVDHNGPVSVTSRPTWKVDLRALADVRHVMADHPHGVVVLPPTQMRVMSMTTTQAYPVVPRTWYARILKEPAARKHARFVLSRLASNHAKHLPGPVAVARSLDLLHVSLACTARVADRGKAVAAIAGDGFGDEKRYGHLVCLRRLG